MEKIHILDQELINKIAAGEVVERPSSVIKELVENSLDARSSRIEIHIDQGGIERIQVTDNGEGMSAKDAKLSLVRHATSKIKESEDLFKLSSMGFRGEALASIAAVSMFSLITKRNEDAHGVKVYLNASHEIKSEAAAANFGTVIKVDQLFHKVPARQKFLKTASTEFSHILKYLQQLALIHPQVELILIHNAKEIFHYLPNNFKERVRQVLGRQTMQKLVPIQHEQFGIQVSGFISLPSWVHATHKNQYLFVNRRPIYDHLVSRSVLEAYETMIPKGYHPTFILKLEIPPDQVDVNVHPRKSEVRFLQTSQIIKLLKSAVKKSLRESDIIPKQSLHSGFEASQNIFQDRSPYQVSQSHRPIAQFSKKPSFPQVQGALKFSQSFSTGIGQRKMSPLQEHSWRIIGQAHLSFILVETASGIQILDQHAVSEIVNYQKISTAYKQGTIESQALLIPEIIDLTLEELEISSQRKESLKKLGWEYEQTGPLSLQISALPEILKKENTLKQFMDLITHLKEEKYPDMTTREFELIKYQSCRSAIMFGDHLSFASIESLLNQWLLIDNNAACEHGRPSAAKLSTDEIRSFFGRGKIQVGEKTC